MRAEAQDLIDKFGAALALLRRFLDWDRAVRRLDELNAKVEDPTLWNDAKAAQEVMRERRRLDEAISATRAIETECADTAELIAGSQFVEVIIAPAVSRAALAAFEAAIHADSDAVPSDFQFHMEVARATGNRHFADLMTYLGTMIIPRTRINTANSAPEGRLAYLQRVHGEHQKIYQAIHARDADAARLAMRTHLANSRERLRRAQPN